MKMGAICQNPSCQQLTQIECKQNKPTNKETVGIRCWETCGINKYKVNKIIVKKIMIVFSQVFDIVLDRVRLSLPLQEKINK